VCVSYYVSFPNSPTSSSVPPVPVVEPLAPESVDRPAVPRHRSVWLTALAVVVVGTAMASITVASRRSGVVNHALAPLTAPPESDPTLGTGDGPPAGGLDSGGRKLVETAPAKTVTTITTTTVPPPPMLLDSPPPMPALLGRAPRVAFFGDSLAVEVSP
jgi:hypothetical protein